MLPNENIQDGHQEDGDHVLATNKLSKPISF